MALFKLIIILSIIGIGAGYYTHLGDENRENAPEPPQNNNPEPGQDNNLEQSPGFNERKAEDLIHEKVNEYRNTQGRPELGQDRELAEIAETHSENMAEHGFFSHRDHRSRTPRNRAEEADYNCPTDHVHSIGENIAPMTYSENLENTPFPSTEEEIAEFTVNQWSNSPGHNQNMLNSHWEYQGIGLHNDGSRIYVTQKFC